MKKVFLTGLAAVLAIALVVPMLGSVFSNGSTFSSGTAQAAEIPLYPGIERIDDATFVQEVLDADKPVVIKFYADWCGPCHRYAPTFGAVAADNNGDIKFVEIDVDDNPNVSKLFVRSIPTTVYVHHEADGTVSIELKPGNLSESSLESFISSNGNGTAQRIKLTDEQMEILRAVR